MQDQEQSTLSASINSSQILDTWNQERDIEQLRSFVSNKLDQFAE